MNDNVISVLSDKSPSGISKSQFRRIDQVFSRAVAEKTLTYRTVDCDFDKGTMMISLAETPYHSPSVAFAANKVGPQTTMYELYVEGKGRVVKSTLFDRVFEAYRDTVESLISEK